MDGWFKDVKFVISQTTYFLRKSMAFTFFAREASCFYNYRGEYGCANTTGVEGLLLASLWNKKMDIFYSKLPIKSDVAWKFSCLSLLTCYDAYCFAVIIVYWKNTSNRNERLAAWDKQTDTGWDGCSNSERLLHKQTSLSKSDMQTHRHEKTMSERFICQILHFFVLDNQL